MGLFSSTTFNSLEDLFVDQIQDLYNAEQQLTAALPKMAAAAHSPALRAAFEQHLRETQGQIARLERVFQILGRKAEGKTCQAMTGLVAEGSEVISAKGDPDVKDAALIAAAQRVEHYEIAGYGTVATYAEMLGRMQDHQLLGETLREEKMTDEKLNSLAKTVVNPEAAQA